MVYLKIQVTDDLEKKFREIAMRRFGHKKGSLSIAAEEALGKWTSRNEEEEVVRKVARKHAKDPIDELEGALSHIRNKTSVQLKREALDDWAEMTMHYKKGKK